MPNKNVCMTSIIIVLTINSKQVALLYQTAANLPEDTVSDPIPASCNNQHLHRLRATELFGENDRSCPDSKVDQVNKPLGFPAVHKSLRKTTTMNP